MKKPRKEMRISRRKMKAEINRLNKMLAHEINTNRVHVETYRSEKKIKIFDAGSKELLASAQNDLKKELYARLEQNGCITFAMEEEPRVCGVKITADIKIVSQ